MKLSTCELLKNKRIEKGIYILIEFIVMESFNLIKDKFDEKEQYFNELRNASFV